MLEINWGDVVNILNNCKPYLIGLAAVVILAVIVMIAVRKMEKRKKKLIRSQGWIAMFVALVTVVNLICFVPMSTIITLATGEGVISDASVETAKETCEDIAGEGIVLLKNESDMLPLAESSNLNVFGWASTNPCYGGTGSGGLSDSYPKVTLLKGLENEGFTLNSGLEKFYVDYRAEHPEIGPFVQDWTLPEPPASAYTDELLGDAKEFSDTALIVLSRTGAEHADLPTNASAIDQIWADDNPMFAASYEDNSSEYEDFPEGTHFLELSQSEKDMVELVCSNFDNIVVVLNSSNVMEMGFVNDYEQIKSAVWCAGPGQTGFDALGKVLDGELNPSGKTSDIFPADFTSMPSYYNFGTFVYDNMTEYVGDSWGYPTTPTFVNYVENIYVGYRYYETAAEEGIINYDEEIVFPFGHGLSYTTFEQEMGEITASGGQISFDVTVTNTGDVPGKDVVEIYYNPPYTDGGIEKASVNLLTFDKTEELQPGEAETVTISFDEEDMASYDYSGAGCYVLEAGDYGISVRSSSHDVIAEQNYHVAEPVTYDENHQRSDDEVAAANQLDDAAGEVTYLSRAGHFANLEEATSAPSAYSLSDEYKEQFLYNDNYEPADYNDDTLEMPVTGADNGIGLAELRGAGYDDEKWDALLDQLTVSDMSNMIAMAGFQTAEADSVDKISTVDCDGPASINNNFTGIGSIGFPSATMIACTWNVDMAHAFGDGIGRMADEMGVSGWYAPAMNIHRSPFGGRNFEYYSEDGVLSGMMGANAVAAAADHGVYGYIKHFALNDQEYMRQSMLCTWSTEQAIREIYLKPFEMSVKEGGATAVMSSYNYIGVTYAGAKKELLTDILRDEWGFRGMVLTDYYGGFHYQDADQIIRAGGDACLATYDVGTNYVDDKTSATAVTEMRRAAKNIMYTVVNSRAYADGNYNAGLQNWQMAAIIVDVLLGAAVIVLEIMAVCNYRRRRTETVEIINKTEK